jgi:hypothetical protein
MEVKACVCPVADWFVVKFVLALPGSLGYLASFMTSHCWLVTSLVCSTMRFRVSCLIGHGRVQCGMFLHFLFPWRCASGHGYSSGFLLSVVTKGYLYCGLQFAEFIAASGDRR